MPAPKGNQFWKARTKHGRDKLFSTPEVLSEACYEYFQWCEDNPLMASEVVKFQGTASLTEVPKMRAMTINGLCIFLGTNMQTWKNYRDNKDFFDVVHEAEEIIYTQKFTGAAADMLNPNIIARDLGLADKQAHTGADDGPIEVKTDEETLRRLAFMLRNKEENTNG